jgi:hypothetical protein
MAMQFRVAVEIEGSSPEIFKIGFVFSDEEGSGIEYYSNHDLPGHVSEKLGALAIDFTSSIKLAISCSQRCTDHQSTGRQVRGLAGLPAPVKTPVPWSPEWGPGPAWDHKRLHPHAVIQRRGGGAGCLRSCATKSENQPDMSTNARRGDLPAFTRARPRPPADPGTGCEGAGAVREGR